MWQSNERRFGVASKLLAGSNSGNYPVLSNCVPAKTKPVFDSLGAALN